MAKSYEKLKMPRKQAYEYEQILKLRPDDMQVLYYLGKIYFQLEENAKGFKEGTFRTIRFKCCNY